MWLYKIYDIIILSFPDLANAISYLHFLNLATYHLHILPFLRNPSLVFFLLFFFFYPCEFLRLANGL